MSVKIKDRNTDTEYLRMALNICELGVDYIHADLILRVQKELKRLKGKFSLNDGARIHHEWKQHWEKYFEDQNKLNETNKQ